MNETSPLKVERAHGDKEEHQPMNLGERVRELRKAKGWTLEVAAQEAGLARSTLSKIENQQMSPTYDAVIKLAHGLDLTLPQLFSPQPHQNDSARLSITKSKEGDALITPTYQHDMLHTDLRNKKMLPYRTRIRTRSFEDFEGWVRHDGEEFLFVLTGIVGFYSESHDMIELRRGDSAYYDASMGHNLISISPEDAEVLWVTSI